MTSQDMNFDSDPAAGDVAFLEEQINRLNMEETGLRDGGLLTRLVRDAAGEIVAGIYGWTWGGCCEIRYLWVREDQRGRGYGTELLRAAEQEATARGCIQVVLDTHSFQAPEFYRKQGYEVVGVVDDYPVGHQKIYLRKHLSSGE
jgi:GNAT superfamily N-acetyltransferase